jgi:D-hexose-6-phosphate mutarotase
MDPRLKRAIAVVSSGNERLVIWNPGETASIADFDADSWRRFVCVEPVSDWPLARTLAPGEKHELCTAIQSAIDL